MQIELHCVASEEPVRDLKTQSHLQLSTMLFAMLLCLPAITIGDISLEEEMSSILVQEKLVGVAWMLVTPKGGIETGAAGFSDNEAQSPFASQTRFHVGSVTKLLLSTGVLRMASTGLLELDDPADQYLPGLEFNNPWRDVAPVTVRHLLDHTSGLEDARLWQMFSERPQPDTALTDAFPDPEKLLQIRTRPGSRFSYSNMGYGLLGMIIESLGKQRYETWLDQNLLSRLDMNSSTFAFTSQQGANPDLLLAWGHVDDGGRYPAAPIFLRPAGQFTTTSGDLGTFAQFLMRDGSINGETFINSRLMRTRAKPSDTLAADAGLNAGYSLGLGRRDRHGVISFCHGGNIVGFVSMLCIYPAQGKAFAYSVNTDSETASYSEFAAALIRKLDPEPAKAPPNGPMARDSADWFGWYIPSPNRFASFLYLDTLFGAGKLGSSENGVVFDTVQASPRVLRATGGYLFSAENRDTASHVLVRGEYGEFLLSDGFNSYEKVNAAYVFALGASLLAGLCGLTWFLVTGLLSVLRYRSGAWSRPETPALIGILGLFLPLPLFMWQSFMALGDLTPASALLALVSLILPLTVVITLLRAARSRGRVRIVHCLAALSVIQWCVVLAAFGMLPLMMWR